MAVLLQARLRPVLLHQSVKWPFGRAQRLWNTQIRAQLYFILCYAQLVGPKAESLGMASGSDSHRAISAIESQTNTVITIFDPLGCVFVAQAN